MASSPLAPCEQRRAALALFSKTRPVCGQLGEARWRGAMYVG